MYVLKVKRTLSVHFDFIVASATIHWSTLAGLEWDFGFFTALGAHRREHLASGIVAVISITLCLPGFTACGTALGLISIAFSLEELLFLGAEGKGCPTIGAGE
jgi:hypothetical protein